jgi:hypothetical protein
MITPLLKQPPPTKKSLIIKLLLNFMLAIAILLTLSYSTKLSWLQSVKDFAYDKKMDWQSNLEPRLADGRKMQPLALIEIDDSTYRQWGSPIITPRSAIRSLIEQAKHGGANVIVVDIDLTWLSDGCFHEPEHSPICSPQQLNADIALGLYLQQLNEEFFKPDQYDTPIILLKRNYRQPLNKDGYLETNAFEEKPYSFLDGYLKTEQNVFWSASFLQPDNDQVQRRWPLVALACEDHHLAAVPSLPLLAAMAQLYSCKDSTRQAAYLIRDLKRRLNEWAHTLPCEPQLGLTIPQLCQTIACPDLTVTLPAKAGVSDKVHRIDLAKGSATERIIYRLMPTNQLTSIQPRLIDRYRALTVLERNISVDQQIVLIGNTHEENRDNYVIPLHHQVLTGSYVIANAIDTLMRFGQFQPSSLLYKISLLMGMIILLTLTFGYYKFIIAFIFNILFIVILVWIESRLVHYDIGVEITCGSILAIQLAQVYYLKVITAKTSMTLS